MNRAVSMKLAGDKMRNMLWDIQHIATSNALGGDE